MQEMATAIGDQQQAAHFKEVFTKIKAAFRKHYTNAEGKFICNAAAYGDGKGYVDGNMGFEGHTQTAYANLYFS
ncbi:MAG: hypothetical protein R2822_10815 [Spirosomataceae bacterium]